MGMGGGIWKFMVGGAVAALYLTWTALSRTKGQQQRSIRRALEAGAPSYSHPLLALERPADEARLRLLLERPVGLLTVLSGPGGAGKTALLRRVLAGRPLVWLLDLRATPPASDQDFASYLLAALGYRLPQAEMLRRWLLRERQPKRALEAAEADAGMARLLEVLQLEAARRAEDPLRRVPLLVVNGPEALAPLLPASLFAGGSQGGAAAAPADKGDKGDKGDKPKKDKGEKPAKAAESALATAPLFTKFLNMCIHATDAGLARVVLVTSRGFADALDALPGWRLRRELVCVDFAQPALVQQYLQKETSVYLTTLGSRALKADEAAHAAEVLGGCVTDLNFFTTYLLAGFDARGAVERLVHDGVEAVLDVLHAQQEEAASAGKDQRKQLLERQVATWSLLELLAREPLLPRHSIMQQIEHFAEHPRDLDLLERAGLIACMENRLADLPLPNPGSAAEAAPTPAATAAVAAAAVSGEAGRPSYWRTMLVQPALPRLRAAFQLVIADPHAQQIRADANAALKKRKWKEKRADLREDEARLLAELRDAAAQEVALATAATQMRELYGPERLLQHKTRTSERVDQIEQQLSALRGELAELERKLDKDDK